MKRSEMINVMLNACKSLYGMSIHDPKFERRLCEVILTAQEEAGMKPPSIIETFMLADLESRRTVFKWEPEEVIESDDTFNNCCGKCKLDK